NLDDLDASRVTNGDSHDHVGVDGALITGPSIETSPASTGSQVVTAGATWTPATGVYQIVGNNDIAAASGSIHLELFISAAWRIGVEEGIGLTNSITYCDGTNMRLHNDFGVATITVWYQKF
ncbi:hypothetical protein KAR91_84780, partial [Candidatus Pacearchaeota archaeon]|nr:hypothetical protein [Candidatus Pacearchaeota archaeon]